MPFNLDDLTKLEVSSISAQDTFNADKVMTAIIKVASADYVPKNVLVRARISPLILTCEFQGKVLTELEKDAKVESISINKTMHGESDGKKD